MATHEQRVLISRLGGLERAARYDGRAVTEVASKRLIEGFREQARAAAAERGEELSEAEIVRRGEALRRAHYVRLALRSAQVRRARSEREKKGDGTHSAALIEEGSRDDAATSPIGVPA